MFPIYSYAKFSIPLRSYYWCTEFRFDSFKFIAGYLYDLRILNYMYTEWMVVAIFILFESSFEVELCTQIKKNIKNKLPSYQSSGKVSHMIVQVICRSCIYNKSAHFKSE